MLTSSSLWKFLDTVLEEEFFFLLFFIIFFFNTNSPDGWGQEFHNHRGAQLFQGLNVATGCHSFDNNKKQIEIWALEIGLKQEMRVAM